MPRISYERLEILQKYNQGNQILHDYLVFI